VGGDKIVTALNVKPKSFKTHMKSRIADYEAVRLYLGEDYAVFEFDFMYQMTSAVSTVKHYCKQFGYRVFDDDAYRMVIVNTYNGGD